MIRALVAIALVAQGIAFYGIYFARNVACDPDCVWHWANANESGWLAIGFVSTLMGFAALSACLPEGPGTRGDG